MGRIAGGVAFLSLAGVFFGAEAPRSYVLPPDLLAALKMPNSFELRHKVSDIPTSVQIAFASAARIRAFSMAEPGARWQATDFIEMPMLPFRRLKAVAVSPSFCLVFYEHGGFANTNNVAAFRLSKNGAEPVWRAHLPSDVVDVAGLRIAVETKKTIEGQGYF